MTQEEFDKKLDDVFDTLKKNAKTYREALCEKFADDIKAAPDNYSLPKNVAIAIMFRLIDATGGFQYGQYPNDFVKKNRKTIRKFSPNIPAI